MLIYFHLFRIVNCYTYYFCGNKGENPYMTSIIASIFRNNLILNPDFDERCHAAISSFVLISDACANI